ncbi:STAS domain-containing protein [Pseudonocardia saturnea]
MEDQVDEPTTSLRPVPASGGRLAVEAHHPRSGVVVLLVSGDLVAGTAAMLQRRLSETLAPGSRGRRVAVDLSGVTTITAPGLDVLLEAQERLEREGGRLELLAPSSPVILLLHDAAAS